MHESYGLCCKIAGLLDHEQLSDGDLAEIRRVSALQVALITATGQIVAGRKGSATLPGSDAIVAGILSYNHLGWGGFDHVLCSKIPQRGNKFSL